MPLPIPSAAAVASFHDLYLAEFGIDLSPQDCLEVATHTLQLFFLKHYPVRPAPSGLPRSLPQKGLQTRAKTVSKMSYEMSCEIK